MIITLQNRGAYAKTLVDQASGQLPLYLGPSRHGQHSSADLSPAQFLAYFEIIKRYTTSKKLLDGNAHLLLIADRGASEISADDLLKGMIDGHLGAEAQGLASAFVDSRDAAAQAKAAWEAERRALLTGGALRAS